ncbi:HlyD family efflux transporter periplasmic adaptor subunit [Pontibacter sp. 172403-2]|uniref:efflux RND transporter periplasmic adaptor subunit n=1 Tax=Pontibacter rufus TaxID=2791028 RepID=UPI0018AFF5BE|nr:HlyD family efflux transporter periplasmic adaptor subunit [Pontibacter sp. 172403-2]MBF9252841.1 HlyD family efflux transporter periplasmic adaptor subunit [Pontibacter sp. 172403-2]
MRYLRYTCYLLASLLASCSSSSEPDAAADETEVKTPVTVTTVSNAPLKETIDLNAISTYQKKNTVKAGTDGYIQKVFVTLGEHVQAGAPLFTMKTKEARVLGDLMTQDPSLHFNGIITIKAPASGVLLEINHQAGDYVNDGDQLALIAGLNSFVFLVNVPFVLNQYVTIGTKATIILPDSTKIPGTVASKLSTMNTAAQTQQFVIKPQTNAILPENLQAIVRLDKKTKAQTQVLSKAAVLTNETMDAYWVMKLINDTTAVKIPIKTGITTEDAVEILSPNFSPADRILTSGNYGLPDTAYVLVQKQQPE